MTANANAHDPAGQPGVPVDDIDIMLRDDLHTSIQGRGVVDGIPYGEQLITERREVGLMYRFRPGAAGRLRAATRKALGRS